MKILGNLDREALKGAGRTAGALMCGNAFVGFFVLGKTTTNDIFLLAALLLIGFGIIMVASQKTP
jgi:hypothetical protein